MSDARQFPGWLPPWFFPAPGPTYLKVEREVKARGVCRFSIATRLTQAAEPARAGLTPTAWPPRPAAWGTVAMAGEGRQEFELRGGQRPGSHTGSTLTTLLS